MCQVGDPLTRPTFENKSADPDGMATTRLMYPRRLFRLEIFRSYRPLLLLLLVLLLLLPLFVLLALTNGRLHMWSLSGTCASRPLEPVVLCEGVRLLLLIPSAPHEGERRTVIRETWARGLHGSPVRLVFIVGRSYQPFDAASLYQEWSVHKDILYKPSLQDSYKRLTQKSLFALSWAMQACPSVPFLAKVDTDVFLHANNLLRLLHNMPQADFILGQVNVRASPKRNPNSKWFAPRSVYPAAAFPNYVFGAFYLMPSSTARRLLDQIRAPDLQLAEKLHLEDVFITGLMAKRLGINRRHHPAFVQALRPGDLCTYPQLISVHHVRPSLMRLMWKLSNEC